MGAPFFRFKQFTVWHDRCAMKVGTDGVLLGAWCPLPTHTCAGASMRVLDIGTGSGLIALMLAQRLHEKSKNYQIIGIDIDPIAVEQSKNNFEQSPWHSHLRSEVCRLQEFQSSEKFALIVSNPPYFQNSLKNPSDARAAARHTDSLSYHDLVGYSANLLTENGILALVLPAEAEKDIIELSILHHLQLTEIIYVHPKEGKAIKRILISFRKSKDAPLEPISTHFYIESSDSPRSKEYQEITKDFYL